MFVIGYLHYHCEVLLFFTLKYLIKYNWTSAPMVYWYMLSVPGCGQHAGATIDVQSVLNIDDKLSWRGQGCACISRSCDGNTGNACQPVSKGTDLKFPWRQRVRIVIHLRACTSMKRLHIRRRA